MPDFGLVVQERLIEQRNAGGVAHGAGTGYPCFPHFGPLQRLQTDRRARSAVPAAGANIASKPAGIAVSPSIPRTSDIGARSPVSTMFWMSPCSSRATPSSNRSSPNGSSTRSRRAALWIRSRCAGDKFRHHIMSGEPVISKSRAWLPIERPRLHLLNPCTTVCNGVEVQCGLRRIPLVNNSK